MSEARIDCIVADDYVRMTVCEDITMQNVLYSSITANIDLHDLGLIEELIQKLTDAKYELQQKRLAESLVREVKGE